MKGFGSVLLYVLSAISLRLVAKPASRDTPICLDAPCMFGCPPYVWITPCMFGCPHVWTPSCMFGCPHMFGHPNMFGCPHLFGCIPCMLGCPLCLDNPLYVWMPHMFGYSPVCLGTSMFECPLNMCGHSHMFGCPHMFRKCLDSCCTYMTHRKHALSDWGGDHVPPYIWMPSYVWQYPNIQWGSQTYGGHPNIWWHPNIQGASKCMGHIHTPLVWQSKLSLCYWYTGGIHMYGAYGHPPSLTKHAFFVLCMYRGHPNVIQTYGGI